MRKLRQHLDDYLAIRRSMGFKLERAHHLLPDFVAYLERYRAKTITVALALAWAKQPLSAHPAWWAARLGLVRGFARHVQAHDPRTEVPPASLLPRVVRRAVPYLYSDSEIGRLVDAARRFPQPLRAATYSTFFGLLAVTGLRLGEAVHLDRDDVDLHGRLLVIRLSKFGKSREVPLHASTVGELRGYADMRDSVFVRPRSPAFFLSLAGTRLIKQNAQIAFQQLVRDAGIRARSATCRPRLHDLRHTFAVRTLIEWYRTDVDVQARLPVLSTYLGHVNPHSTYWYLHAAPELLALTSQRLERDWGAR